MRNTEVTERLMGLQNQLSDVSSESILVFVVVLIGKSVNYLQSLILTILRKISLLSPSFDTDDNHHLLSAFNDVVGLGLASIVILCDQLNLNRVCSYPNQSDAAEDLDTDCVVCLNRFGQGDHVRRLACRHLFHKDCFDGWLNHLSFNCPLCRSPVASGEHVEFAQRRVAADLLAWFPSL